MSAGSEGSWIPSANMSMNLSERGEGGKKNFGSFWGNGGCVPPQVRGWRESVEGWKGFN